jgi:hypothetical protein
MHTVMHFELHLLLGDIQGPGLPGSARAGPENDSAGKAQQ